MPSPRLLVIYLLTLATELLAGFALIAGSGLLGAITPGYAFFWILLFAAGCGLAAEISVAIGGPGEPLNRILLLAGALPAVLLPSWLTSHGWEAFSLSVPLLAIAYWRGLRASQEHLQVEDVHGRFAVGFGVILMAVVWTVSRGVPQQSSLWELLAVAGVAYVVLSLIALVAVRTDHAREPGAGVAITLAVILQLGVVLLLAGIAVQAFRLNVAGDAGAIVAPVWQAFENVLYALVVLIGRPFQWFISSVAFHHLGRPKLTPPPPVPTRGHHRHPLVLHHTSNQSIVIAVALFILGLVVAISRLVWVSLPRITRRGPKPEYVERRQFLWNLPRAWQLFRSWLRSVFSRGVESAGASVRRLRAGFRPDYPDDPIRRVYVQFLRRAAGAGLPRGPGETPAEYQRSVTAKWPLAADDVAALTNAYVQHRYGDGSVTPAKVEAVRRHWQQVRVKVRAPRERS